MTHEVIDYRYRTSWFFETYELAIKFINRHRDKTMFDYRGYP
jgi:hypothetical protein